MNRNEDWLLPPGPDGPQPWAYTLAPLPVAISKQLDRILEGVVPDTVTIDIRFHRDHIRSIDRTQLPAHVQVHDSDGDLDFAINYPEKPGVTTMLWEMIVEGWTGPRGDPWTECWTFAVAGNNLL